MTGTINATQELGAFLRARRERLQPAELGLAIRKQSRRTPGLRREEVAELAGVSTDYIVRLEQGRGQRPTAEVLQALARARRFNLDETADLLDLAQQRQPNSDKPAPLPAPPQGNHVEDFAPQPAHEVDHPQQKHARQPVNYP
uniref:helix-turn-helix domain-containing protein n=1 Tax=Nocardia cyriacigeorgica TaxID=135487 RepID=UPI002453D2CF